MCASGNDFIVIDSQDMFFDLSAKEIQSLCHRRLGVGADQLLVIEHSPQAHGKMRIFNADGGEVEQCGNGARCVAYYLSQKNQTSHITLKTRSGIHQSSIDSIQCVSINLGKPNTLYPVEIDYEGLTDPVFVDMGNPHLVFYVPDVEAIDLETMGSYFEKHSMFPQGANVHFVEALSSNHVKIKVWERGVGVTWACGSGACAAVAAGISLQKLKVPLVSVTFEHETLLVSLESDGSLSLKGPVHWVFTGNVSLSRQERNT
jgi:diaminopimelate epimerase